MHTFQYIGYSNFALYSKEFLHTSTQIAMQYNEKTMRNENKKTNYIGVWWGTYFYRAANKANTVSVCTNIQKFQKKKNKRTDQIEFIV